MIAIHLIPRLVSFPIVLFGKVFAALNLPLAIPLLKIGWFIGRDEIAAVVALAQITKEQGPETALAQAEVWLSKHPQLALAACAGMTARDLGDYEKARSFLEKGRTLGDDSHGLLDLLEMSLAERTNDPESGIKIAEKLSRRNDVSPMVSELALIAMLWKEMLYRRFSEARVLALRLLAVDNEPKASIAMWALERLEGRTESAEKYLRIADVLPKDQRLYLTYLACFTAGFTEQAHEALTELREVNSDYSANAEQAVAHLIEGTQA